tara:strand:- start:1394 stop:1786 length:393 start_codon:yes stop_codon:yes gene_type:complete
MLVVIAVSDEERLAISAKRLEGIIEESIKNDDDETREKFLSLIYRETSVFYDYGDNEKMYAISRNKLIRTHPKIVNYFSKNNLCWEEAEIWEVNFDWDDWDISYKYYRNLGHVEGVKYTGNKIKMVSRCD